ncbi:MAG: hypothetical protein KDD25_09490, partial [Bdellovibrionales bacterium]|nr:hypothetical protein [Bdellovibrionales bacterium]
LIYPGIFGGVVDKSASILGFCKSLDVYLEKIFINKKFFNNLEKNGRQFQNLLHQLGLGGDSVDATRLLSQLQLSSVFDVSQFPFHKLKLIADEILSGRMLRHRFKSIDGLRAWGLILVLYSRKVIPNQSALVPFEGLSDIAIADIGKRMMILQDLRNPAAHRQTVFDMGAVVTVRKEVFSLLHLLTPKS